MLLDERGRAVHVYPLDNTFKGRSLLRYDHLHRAVRGTPAVSDVVRSAVRSEPIVAFAVPFRSRNGRRVFSGGLPLQRSILGAFLRNATPIRGSQVALVDGSGQAIAHGAVRPEAALLAPGPGHLNVRGKEYVVASAPVARTPWRVVAAAPVSALYRPISGPTRWLPWALFVGLALAAGACLLLLTRLLERQAQLAALAERDPLTGAGNRRALAAAFDRAAAEMRPMAVLALDLDDFKSINDRHGHEAGDDALRTVAATLRQLVRPADVVARVGGDEFAVLLLGSDVQGAMLVARRIVAGLPTTATASSGAAGLNCSVGIAVAAAGQSLDDVLRDADAALYAAKRAGKNRWKLRARRKRRRSRRTRPHDRVSPVPPRPGSQLRTAWWS